MIYCLTGKLLEKAPDYAVVSCGGKEVDTVWISYLKP